MLLRELMCIKGFLIQERCHGGEMGSGTVSLRVEERGCTLDGSPPSVTIDLHIFMYIIVWLITLLMGCVRLSATLESRRMASGKCKSHVDIGPIERDNIMETGKRNILRAVSTRHTRSIFIWSHGRMPWLWCQRTDIC